MAHYRPVPPKNVMLHITYVKSEFGFLKFWALPPHAVETVHKLEKIFLEKYDELNSTSDFMHTYLTPPGLKCAVKSKAKQQWCRARVLVPSSISEVSVQLIDYGNEETIAVSNVRKVDEQMFFSHPPLAIECILADVIPSGGTEWSPEAVRYCEQQLLYQTLSGYVVAEYIKTPVIRIAKSGENEPFVQRLINIGLAAIKPPPEENISPPYVKKEAYSPAMYKVVPLDKNTEHLVSISYVESPHKFFIQLTAVEVELRRLMDSIKVWSEQEQLSLVNAPIKNTPCLARINSKSCYYRALIIGVVQGRCTVYFVDYGFTESIDFQEIKAIPTFFLNLPTQAIACSLSRDILINKEAFIQVTSKKYLTCHIIGYTEDVYIVRLFKDEQDILMPRQVYADPTQFMTYKQQKLSIGVTLDVTISFINDLNDFYCQLSQTKDQLDTISSVLNSRCEFTTMTFHDCVPNLPVCVKFSEDNLWYRAQITRLDNENEIEVFFVDFGNVENVKLLDIRRMKPDLLKYPIQAFKCSLLGIQIPSDSPLKDTMFDLFEELTTRQNLVLVVSHVIDQSYAVTLYENNSSISINEKIESKSLSINCVSVSNIENLFVTSYESPEMFFAQFEKLDQDKLSEMQIEIDSFYAESKNGNFLPQVGNLVCAKFKEDERFYRARVEACKDSACDVFFIDYGNHESVQLQDIHPMNSKFTNYPQFGINCRFEKYPLETPVDKLQSLMLDNSIQANMIKEQRGKWHITLTENFPGNVAILELLRQHESVVPRSIHGAGLKGYIDSSIRSESPSPSSDIKGYGKPQNSCTSLSSTQSNAKHLLNLEDYDEIAIPPKAFRNVYVSHVVNPSEFYCQLEEDMAKLQVLMKNIQDFYASINNNEFIILKFLIGSPCCAVYQVDGAWYRGKIKALNPRVNPTTAEIFFVDYGNADYVPVSQVRILNPIFISLHPQALRCSSFNVSPVSETWSTADVDVFREMTCDKSFVAQFVDMNESGTHLVNLVNIGKIEDDILNKEFVSLGHGCLQDSNKVLVLNAHSASNYLTFQKLNIKMNTTESVVVTWVLNPSEFFCQLKHLSVEFTKMMVEIQKYYNRISEAECVIDRPHAGMICVAEFSEDPGWYRAEIQKVEKNAITVFYVDYGNSETINRNKIRFILKDFTILPIQGIKCRIQGIRKPGNSWPSFTPGLGVKYFGGDVDCRFIAEEKYYILVDISCNQRNIGQEMVSAGIAAVDEETYGKPDVPKQVKTVAVLQNSTVVPVISTLPKRELSFIVGQLISVIVSFVENPSKFWCQLQDESESLEELMGAIEFYYSKIENASVSPGWLKVGDSCVAKYSADNAWYRAVIKSCPTQNEFDVMFIDYGNSEVTNLSKVALIIPEFVELLPQAFECKLHNAPNNVSDETIELFQHLVDEAEELTAKVEATTNNICLVSLFYDKDAEEINVSETLLSANFEACIEPNDLVRFQSPDVPLGLHEGYVTTVTNPQDFYVQLGSYESPLAELTTNLSKTYDLMTDVQNLVQNPCVGLACAAKYSEDENWYRAEITSVRETTVAVLFVDYGNIDEVPRSSLKELGDEFLSVPPYAVKCKLNGIVSSGEQWSENAVAAFDEIVTESVLSITFISKDSPVSVNILKDEKDVAQVLMEMDLAIIDSIVETEDAYSEDHLTTAPIEDNINSTTESEFCLTYPDHKISLSKLPVKICYVDSFDKFYVMPSDLNTELDTVMATLETLYSSATDTDFELVDIKPLIPCAAKYSEDEAWYRALITDIDGDNIFVMFVDYGNSELTSRQNLKSLTPELIKIPPIAIECSLFGIQPVDGKELEIKSKLEEFFLNDVQLDMEVIEQTPYKVKLNCDGDFVNALVEDGLAEVFSVPVERFQDSETFKGNLRIAFVDEPNDEVKKILSRVLSVDEMCGNVKHYEILNEMVVVYVVSEDLEEVLEKQQEKLQMLYGEAENTSMSVKCMDFCAAKYSEDESWYRAQVISCDTEIVVRFIDFGNCDTVPKSNITELFSDFFEEPSFAIQCCLSGCKVVNGKEDLLQSRIEELLYSGPINLKFSSCSWSLPNTRAAEITFDESDISETMVDEQLLSQCYPFQSNLEETFVGTVDKIGQNNIFYILPSKSVPERDNVQTELNEILSTSERNVSEINPCRLYAAKNDDGWFRISVECSADGIVANFVDFGLTTEVNLTDLQLLPQNFCNKPLLLQPCIIKDLEENVLESENDVSQHIEVGSIVMCKRQKPLCQLYPLEVILSLKSEVPFQTNNCNGSDFDVSRIIADTLNKIEEVQSQEQVSLIEQVDQQIVDTTEKEESSLNMQGNEEEMNDSFKESTRNGVEYEELAKEHEEQEQTFEETLEAEDMQQYLEEKIETVTAEGVKEVESIMESTEEDMIEDQITDEALKLSQCQAQICLVEQVNKQVIDATEKEESSLNVQDNEAETDNSLKESNRTVVEYTDEAIDHKEQEKTFGEMLEAEDMQQYLEEKIDTVTAQAVKEVESILDSAEENIIADGEPLSDEVLKLSQKTSVELADKQSTDTQENRESSLNVQNNPTETDNTFQEFAIEVTENKVGNLSMNLEIDTEHNFEESTYNEKEQIPEETTELEQPFRESLQEESNDNVDNYAPQLVEKVTGDETEAFVPNHEIIIQKPSINSQIETGKLPQETTTIAEQLVEEASEMVEIEYLSKNIASNEDLFNEDGTKCEVKFTLEDTTGVDESGYHLAENRTVDKLVKEAKINDKIDLSQKITNSSENNVPQDEESVIDIMYHGRDDSLGVYPEAELKDQMPSDKTSFDGENVLSFGNEPILKSQEDVYENDLKLDDFKPEPGQAKEVKEDYETTEISQEVAEQDRSDDENAQEIKCEENYSEFSESNTPHIDNASSHSNSNELFFETQDNINDSGLELSWSASEPTQIAKETSEEIHELHLSGTLKVIISEIVISGGSVLLSATPLDLVKKLESLQEILQNVYSSKTHPMSEILPNKLYAVLSKDNVWYRGKALSSDDNMITMLYIDYGFSETVDITAVRELEPDHRSIPPFAVWCTLVSASCFYKNEELLKVYLKNIFKGADVTVNVIQGGEPYKISLFVNDHDILPQLVYENLVCQILAKSFVEPGIHNARVSHVNIQSETIELHVNLVSRIEDLEKLKEKMHSAYKSIDQNLVILDSSFYAVYYNGTWHRCQVIFTEPKLTVKLVDSGQRIDTNADLLCPLLSEHCFDPTYAVLCSLHTLEILPEQAEDYLGIFNKLNFSEFPIDCEDDFDGGCYGIYASLTDENFLNKLKEEIHSNTECNSTEVLISECSDSSKLYLEETVISELKANNSEFETLQNIVETLPETPCLKIPSENQVNNENFVGFLKECYATDSLEAPDKSPATNKNSEQT